MLATLPSKKRLREVISERTLSISKIFKSFISDLDNVFDTPDCPIQNNIDIFENCLIRIILITICEGNEVLKRLLRRVVDNGTALEGLSANP